MNIGTAMTLFCGGKGSGCNPEVGKCGRPRGSGSGSQSTARLLVDKINRDGGFTYRPSARRSTRSGFALSISSENERILSKRSITPERVAKVLKEFDPILKKDTRTRVGGWYDPESGKVFLDVSIVVNDKKEAINLAKKHNQLAIFDLNKGKTIRTGVKRNVQHAAAAKKMIRFDFDKGATPEEIVKFIKGLE